MAGLLVALARDFWSRLIGYLASGENNPARIQELALQSPTSTSITHEEASMLGEMGLQSMNAAKEWYNGKEATGIFVPSIPNVEYPHISGDEPGKFNFGVVINEPDSGEQGDPVFFSDDRLTDVEKVMRNLLDYISEGQGRDSVPFYQELFQKLQENRRDALIPLWLYEYISPENYRG